MDGCAAWHPETAFPAGRDDTVEESHGVVAVGEVPGSVDDAAAGVEVGAGFRLRLLHGEQLAKSLASHAAK